MGREFHIANVNFENAKRGVQYRNNSKEVREILNYNYWNSVNYSKLEMKEDIEGKQAVDKAFIVATIVVTIGAVIIGIRSFKRRQNEKQ